jgi:hypothetical protein
MKKKKRDLNWPVEYEAPKVFHIQTALQQALGVTLCGTGTDASGVPGACSAGYSASATDPNACAVGSDAGGGPGHGTPCGHGINPA